MSHKYFTDYKINQYEDLNSSESFIFNNQVKARYIKQEEPSFIGNLLIEALPPVLSFEQLYKHVANFPIYAESERSKTMEYRLTAIGRLQNYVLPFSKYSEIYNKISIVIRRSYEGKKIMVPEFIQALNKSSDLIHLSEDKLDNYREAICNIRNDLGAQYGFSILGLSGTGKTTAVNKILSTIPQCIIHTGSEEEKYLFIQIPWLKIDCSHNGTVKGLCQNIFYKIDEILKTDYLNKYGSSRFSINRMIVTIKQIVQKHAIGVLIIDEIQHLANAKGQAGNALDFFVTLMNEIKVPIVYIGTNKAIKSVLAMEFTQARRSTGLGEVQFENMEQNEQWDYFIEDLWNYQWTKEKVELTSEFKKIMYDETMGIADRVIKLFMAAQLKAILDDKEKLTPQLIRNVVKKNMSLPSDMITALRKNDVGLLKQFSDMKASNVDSMFKHEKYTADAKKKIKEIREEQKESNFKEKIEMINEVAIYFSQLGYEYKFLEEIATKIVEQYGFRTQIELIKRKVAEEIFSKENKKDENKKTTKDKNKSRNK